MAILPSYNVPDPENMGRFGAARAEQIRADRLKRGEQEAAIALQPGQVQMAMAEQKAQLEMQPNKLKLAKFQQEEQMKAMERKQAFNAELESIYAEDGHDPIKLIKLSRKYPGLMAEEGMNMSEQEKSLMRNTAMPIYLAAKNGNTELAKRLALEAIPVMERIDPQDAQMYQMFADSMDDPRQKDFAMDMAATALQEAIGIDEFAKMIDVEIDEEKAPKERDKIEAETKLLKEQAIGQKSARELRRAQTDQIRKDIELFPKKLANEQTKLLVEKKKLENVGMSSIKTDADKKTINDASAAASEALSRGVKARTFLNDLGVLGDTGGFGNVASAKFKKFLGLPLDQQQLKREEIDRFIIDEVLTRLPPGAASDNDVRLIQTRFPQPGATQGEYRNFFESMVKVVDKSRNYEMARLSYLSKNSAHMGDAQKDMEIKLPNGDVIKVPAGSNLDAEWQKKYPPVEPTPGVGGAGGGMSAEQADSILGTF